MKKTKEEKQDYLTLKWGTLKAWNFTSQKGKELLKKYFDLGSSLSAMMQHDTPEQKELICQLIDEGDFETVCNDWENKDMTKEEAKEYVNSYGNQTTNPL